MRALISFSAVSVVPRAAKVAEVSDQFQIQSRPSFQAPMVTTLHLCAFNKTSYFQNNYLEAKQLLKDNNQLSTHAAVSWRRVLIVELNTAEIIAAHYIQLTL